MCVGGRAETNLEAAIERNFGSDENYNTMFHLTAEGYRSSFCSLKYVGVIDRS